jgi:hypothetical protein
MVFSGGRTATNDLLALETIKPTKSVNDKYHHPRRAELGALAASWILRLAIAFF